jgi:hypothetical protein
MLVRPPKRNAASKQAAYRRRWRSGMVSPHITFHHADVAAALARRGFIDPRDQEDIRAVRQALEAALVVFGRYGKI